MMIRHLKLRGAVSIMLVLAAANAAAAELIISKSKRSLEFRDGDISRVFQIALGSSPFGPKSMQGDRKTPEGVYYVTHKNSKSQFYLSVGISYPNLDDAKLGLRSGLISKNEYALI